MTFKEWLKKIEEVGTFASGATGGAGSIESYPQRLGMPQTGNAFIDGDAQDAFEKCGPTMCGGHSMKKRKHKHR
jgi:hypothetical protein